MFLNFDENLRLHVKTREAAEKGTTPLLMLHGFTGCAEDWNSLAEGIPGKYRTAAADLPGHGETSSPGNPVYYQSDYLADEIKFICDSIDSGKVIVLGYSMGGRAALTFAAKYPERIGAMILESTSPGLKAPEDRKARKESDEALARLIEEKGIEEFTDRWADAPIFRTQRELPAEKLNAIRQLRLKNSITGLSNSLRGFSTGIMPELWSSLDKLQFPVLLISGEQDEKFTTINREMIKVLPNATHSIIKSGGHNTHLEKPEVFLNLVLEFLRKTGIQNK
ncbi:MAG: 2-succinyl-6-hydroxy-2,4-cyclohexadiene-1-carboxylate synthase [Syntrophothermus sp.]